MSDNIRDVMCRVAHKMGYVAAVRDDCVRYGPCYNDDALQRAWQEGYEQGWDAMVDAKHSLSPAEPAEIDPTPEMIEAGVDAYYRNIGWGWENPGESELRKILVATFRAMAAACRSG